jgi:hypothetical protein
MSSFDPFAYGQVSLGGGGKPKPEGGEPDDILFADAKPAGSAATAPAAGGGAPDTSWELLGADVDGLLPRGGGGGAQPAVDFGADILGETAPAAPARAKPTPKPLPLPTDEPILSPKVPGVPPVPAAAASAAPALVPAKKREPGPAPAPMAGAMGTAPAAITAGAKPKAAIQRPIPAPPQFVRRRGPRALFVPIAVFAAGGTTAAWFYAMQQNMIMAGLTAALTVVATAFSWVWARG